MSTLTEHVRAEFDRLNRKIKEQANALEAAEAKIETAQQLLYAAKAREEEMDIRIAELERQLSEAQAEMRERAAKACESLPNGEGPDNWGWHQKDYAKEIRALPINESAAPAQQVASGQPSVEAQHGTPQAAADHRDAQRYRWLRVASAQNGAIPTWDWWDELGDVLAFEFDNVIDAAMRAEGK